MMNKVVYIALHLTCAMKTACMNIRGRLRGRVIIWQNLQWFNGRPCNDHARGSCVGGFSIDGAANDELKMVTTREECH